MFIFSPLIIHYFVSLCLHQEEFIFALQRLFTSLYATKPLAHHTVNWHV